MKIDKKWDRIMKQMDEEYPDVQPNRFKFRYVGADSYLYDINRKDLHDDPLDEPEDEEIHRDEDESYQRELGELMLKKLRGKRRQIIYKKFWEEKSLAQIGRELKMSRQLVFYHLQKALEYLRDYYK